MASTHVTERYFEQWRQWWPLVALSFAFTVFCLFQLIISHVNGWWLDELYSLWASDPAIPFKEAYVQRIAPDTNPPGYYSLLYWTRHFIADNRKAVVALNTVFLLGASLSLLTSARRSRLVPVAVLSLSLFLLSGPVARYASEGRAYLGALAVVFVASWLAALSIFSPNNRQPTAWFVIVGGLAALIHVYAALYCCALAAGLMVLAMTDPSRSTLLRSGLSLGAFSAGIFGIWFLSVLQSIPRIGFHQFNWHTVFDAANSVLRLTGGPICGAIILALILVYGLRRVDTRPLVILFAIAYSIFIALPILASFKQPIIGGRYWLIGSPGIIVLVSFLLRSWYLELKAENWPTGWQGVVLLGVVSVIWGSTAAYQNIRTKMIWKGADVVMPMINGCPGQSIHVGTGFNVVNGKLSFMIDAIPFYSFLTGQRPDIFVPIVGVEGRILALRDAHCPVVGWAEHLSPNVLKTKTDEELLSLLRIASSPADVEVRRHRSGFVVLRH